MKRSDFITCDNEIKIRKSTVEWYTKYEKSIRVLIGTAHGTWNFNGTLEEFEALLFDEPTTDDFRRGCIAALTWMERRNNADRIVALLRLKSGGDL